MVEDIVQKRVDEVGALTDALLKDEQRRWEPWKALSAAFGAGIAVATALISGIAWVIWHLTGH